MLLADAETPRLLLDPERLQRNIDRMATRCAQLGVTLRPHLKTPKSLHVAQRVAPDTSAPVTVSTLREAEYFAKGGYTDILCAAATTPNKIAHVAQIEQETGTNVLLLTDAVDALQAIDSRAAAHGIDLRFLIEIDSGEHRSGVLPGAPDVLRIADALKAAQRLSLAGVMTHGGHSYAYDDAEKIAEVAEAERSAAVSAADALRSAGHECAVVSVGSTPTVLHARHLEGVTEARAGVYLFQDLAQFSRGICTLDDVAVSVLATVIGHNRADKSLVIDAGALALSKDTTANAYLPDVKYGYLCDAVTMERLEGLSVDKAYQEHGMVPVANESWFERLPIGSQVRVLPNHSCMTCAAYEAYDVIENGEIVDTWPRVNGW